MSAALPDFILTREFQAFANKQLLEIYKKNTIAERMPWSKFEFKISREQFLKLKSGSFEEWQTSSYEEFKKLNDSNGSVDSDPAFWARFIFDKCLESCNRCDSEYFIISVQNGCCSEDSCPIAIYFNILVKRINDF